MVPPTPDFWRGKRVFLTGHTGFKGGWLSLWLQSLGAEVAGLALAPPCEPSLFHVAGVGASMTSTIGDIRSLDTIERTMGAFRPEIVIHMAAQPLVRYSYSEPVETYATNVMGTVHLLEAVRRNSSVRCVVNVTTDKCYENDERESGYCESDRMGGHDPYSNSKGCSELVTSSYRRAFFDKSGIAVASARAGNVIGGGDWASDRLVPDILRAFESKVPVVVRNPTATRPWQHVLEPLSGYLLLAERLWREGAALAEGWNFGPLDEDARPVRWIVEYMAHAWGNGASWRLDDSAHPHEAHYLKLDISKARSRLGWWPRWSLDKALDKVTQWQHAWHEKRDMQQVCLEQIQQYTNGIEKENA
jgi:CDP-glucose 4,6-dehydratase